MEKINYSNLFYGITWGIIAAHLPKDQSKRTVSTISTRAPINPAPLGAGMLLALNLVIGLGHFLVLFNTGAYLPMIPRVAGSLGVNPAYVDWTQANFFLAMALAFPTAAWFLNRWGEMRSLLGAFLAFALASAVCGVSHDYGWFLASRMVQGYAGGITIPISLGVLLRHYTPPHRNMGLTLWGMAAITPFTLGPVLGGWITDTWGWRWLFYLNVPIALAVALIIAIILAGREMEHRHPGLDWVGLLLLLIGVGAFQSALNLGEIDDWLRSTTIIGLLLTGAAALIYFAVWEWNSAHPLLELRFLRRRNFLVGGLGLFLTALCFQGAMALYIVQFQLMLGYSAWLAGLLLLPLAIFSKLTSMLTHRYIHRLDARFVGFIALIGFSIGSFWVSSYSRPASLDELLWPQAMASLFLGALFPPFAAIALSGLRGTAEMRGGAFLNLLRVSGQAMGIPIVGALWDRRRILHRHFLGEGNAMTREQLGSAQHILQRQGIVPEAAHHLIINRIDHQAALLAFNEIFHFAGWAFLLLGVVLLLAKRVTFAEPDAGTRLAMEEMVEP